MFSIEWTSKKATKNGEISMSAYEKTATATLCSLNGRKFTIASYQWIATNDSTNQMKKMNKNKTY